MKILTPEEEAAHNSEVWKGGSLGAIGGIAVGSAGVYIATLRSHTFRQLSVPFRAFLVTGTTAFGGVVTADRYSRAFEKKRDAFSDFKNVSEREQSEFESQKDLWTRAKSFVSEQRYPIVFGSWVASMGLAFGLVGRNKYLTGQQKLVQARVYAQGLTLAVLVASFALESNDLRAGKGRWETVKVLDPNDPEHKRLIDKRIHHERYAGEDQWMDMIAAQEEKVKSRGHNVYSAGGSRAGAGPKEGSDDEIHAAEQREKEEEEKEQKEKEEQEKQKKKEAENKKKNDSGKKNGDSGKKNGDAEKKNGDAGKQKSDDAGKQGDDSGEKKDDAKNDNDAKKNDGAKNNDVAGKEESDSAQADEGKQEKSGKEKKTK